MTFQVWLRAVDIWLGRLCGLGYYDIADQPWRDWYDNQISPEDAARSALEDEGFPFDE